MQPGFVLDGFPRTVAQAAALDRADGRLGTGPLIVVDVAVPEQELVRRLAGRRICSKCGTNADRARRRSRAGAASAAASWCSARDDNQDVVLERLKVYQQATKPVLGLLPRRVRRSASVNGAQAPERVAHGAATRLIDDAAAGEAR